MLEIKGLSIGYQRKKVQSSINARASQGELIVVIGRNGSGKSTFLRTISGLLQPLEGHVLWNGTSVHAMRSIDRARSIAIVQTAVPSWSGLTIAEVVALGAYPKSINAEDERVCSLLKKFHLEELANERLDAVSDGERQKTMIARAIMQHAPLVIMDEPTAFLDFPSRKEWWLHVEKMKAEGHTIIVATHDILMLKEVQIDQSWLFKAGEGMSNHQGFLTEVAID